MVIRIDGSAGEGGGQMLRSSLGLSLVTRQPFRIDNVRAKRERPGLLRQHLTAVLAAAEISGAEVAGATLGSQSLCFAPGAVKPGEYRFAIGTAGSGTLVLQAILPALMMAPAASRLTIEGGTHNMQAPPFDFLEKTFLPVVGRMGPKVSVELKRYGFFPAGGGCFGVTIEPCAKLSTLELIERGEIARVGVKAVVANLPAKIAHRELDTAARLLRLKPRCLEVVETKNSPGAGNVVLVEVETSAGITEIFCGFGRRGVSAETVATQAANEARAHLDSNAVADQHLADQLLLPFALAGGGAFTASALNLHATTNMKVIRSFLPVEFDRFDEADRVRVEIRGSSAA
ncbi:MAG TPA: RNA 3'-terminal phosphate cyclase [Candidatus Acidoferrales bacterium]|jgi:RNA 3'-terminal phosphate cyclase (ATP)|nr:RNA 3'-terminal phosphate cyclase [Candidatus Acidoferrales bacterium]